MATGYTHPICYPCWKDLFRQDPTQEPVRLIQRTIVRCCFCSYTTDSGIYVRHDPSQLTCNHE